jgi:hypothetical protein
MGVELFWRTVTPTRSPSFNVKGTVLSSALFGKNSRFAVYEVRTLDADRMSDREYVVRDAGLVSDADVKAGVKPPIVFRTSDYDRLLEWLGTAN